LRSCPWLKRAGEQQYGDLGPAGHTFGVRRHLIPIHVQHAHVGQNDVRGLGVDLRDRARAIADRNHPHALIGERQFDHAPDGDAVIGEQQRGHRA
jgi:hypothetical protein